MPSRSATWLRPLVYLSNNPVSLLGVILVTAAAVFWIALLPTLWSGEVGNPYEGIVLFMVLPAAFFLGLALIPLGIWMRRRRGDVPEVFPPLDLKNPDFRRLVVFIGATSIVNLIIAGQLSYGAVNYMDSVEFCGQTCHTVMTPEFTAYQNSPHSRVECVKCHIGPGAGWFVRSKLSGVGQVIAVTLNNYPRPIPTPVHNLRPARETCEACHWPQKYGGERLRVMSNYADDETNTLTKTVLMMHIGGGTTVGPGIHGYHLGPGIQVRYFPADESRQTIPVVERTTPDGKTARFVAADAKPEAIQAANDESKWRTMDCMDCHNRPSHTFQLPERAVNQSMASGEIPAALPWVKKHALEVLKADYSSQADAETRLPQAFAKVYQDQHPDVYSSQRAQIDAAAKGILAVYRRNVFPEMRVKWGGYPNNLGHTDFPGCFRCHDDNHAAQDGRKVSQDCNSCHSLLAMDEPNPKVLADLGLAPTAGSGASK
jgi:nitrate/TMAO reductase-like tetraheme cytochrome c subunit